MKLIDLLVEKFKEWPSGVVAISQDVTGNLNTLSYGSVASARKKGIITDEGEDMGIWPSRHWSFLLDGRLLKTADDYRTAIITQEEFELAKQSKFVRHRGGKMPVPARTKIEVRYRNGETSSCEAGDNHSHAWDHSGHSRDIMAYRILEDAQ